MDYRLFNGFDRTNLAGTHWRPYIGSYSGTPQSCFSVNLPLWLPLLPLAVTLTVLWARRRDPAACARCGYLLRGLPSRTCPECGHKNKYTIVCVAQWFTQRRRRAASIHSCGAIVPVSSAMTSGWQ